MRLRLAYIGERKNVDHLDTQIAELDARIEKALRPFVHEAICRRLYEVPRVNRRSMKLTSRFRDALVYAAELHADQKRKAGDVPYMAHLLGVTSIALEHGADEDEAIAALLHDAVEDQGGQPTAAEIQRRFGDRVLEIVLGCTDADTSPKPPWRQRKEAYIAKIEHASRSTWLVAAADKLYNARSVLADFRMLGEAVWSRFNGGKDGTLWYYRSLADKLRDKAPPPLSEELDRAVSDLEREVESRY